MQENCLKKYSDIKDNNKIPLISVIMPFYNPRFDFFCEAVESVLSQTYSNWELIIVNDGSTIKYRKLVEEYLEKVNDKRINITNLEENRGVSTARNKGVELAKGEIITFLDADDMHLPWYYQDIIYSFSKSPDSGILAIYDVQYMPLGKYIKINFADYLYKLTEKKITPDKALELIKDGKGQVFLRLAFKKELRNRIRYDEGLQCNEDSGLYLQIINNKELLNKLVVEPTTGYLYRVYPSKSRLSDKLKLILSARETLIQRYCNEDTLACKTIRHFQINSDLVKFNKVLLNYLNGGSISQYLKESFKLCSSLKEKLISIRLLARIIIIHKLLFPIFGTNLQYCFILSKRSKNYFKYIKSRFQDSLKSDELNNKSKIYAKRIFKTVF